MLKRILIALGAIIATIPGMIFAWAWLRSRRIEIGPEGLVKTFMDNAPRSLRLSLITLNFVNAGALVLGLWFALE